MLLPSLAEKGQVGSGRAGIRCFNLPCEVDKGNVTFPVKAQECFSLLMS